MRRDVRVTVRFSEEELAEVERASRVSGVALGAVIRACALQSCAFLAAEWAAGRVRSGEHVRLRRRSSAGAS